MDMTSTYITKESPMSPKKKPKAEIKYRNLPTNFTQHQIDGLDRIAKLEKKNRSEVIRDAVDFYMLKHGKDEVDLRETELVQQLKRVEQGIRTLLVKNIKLTGENLYWSSLHWADGPPKARLNDEGFKYHWTRAEAFAAALLRTKAKKGEEPAAAEQPHESEQPTKKPKDK